MCTKSIKHSFSWTSVDKCAIQWTNVDFRGQIWTSVNKCGLLWTIMDFCGQMWTSVDKCGLMSTNVDFCLTLRGPLCPFVSYSGPMWLMWSLQDLGLCLTLVFYKNVSNALI